MGGVVELGAGNEGRDLYVSGLAISARRMISFGIEEAGVVTGREARAIGRCLASIERMPQKDRKLGVFPAPGGAIDLAQCGEIGS